MHQAIFLLRSSVILDVYLSSTIVLNEYRRIKDPGGGAGGAPVYDPDTSVYNIRSIGVVCLG